MSYITEELEKAISQEKKKLDSSELQLRRKRLESSRVADEIEILEVSIHDQSLYIQKLERLLHHEEDKEIDAGLKKMTVKK